jgi:hypothetical protein
MSGSNTFIYSYQTFQHNPPIRKTTTLVMTQTCTQCFTQPQEMRDRRQPCIREQHRDMLVGVVAPSRTTPDYAIDGSISGVSLDVGSSTD